jgi:Zn-dependent protease
MDGTLYQAAALIVPLVIAIVFHEVAHGWVALMLGDPTAKERRRLSLNPLRHVDPVGTILVPGLLWLTTHTAFGWAKPVPVIKQRLRNPRFGMMAVAAAGPLTNLVLAGAGALALGLLIAAVGDGRPDQVARFVALNLVNFLWLNVFLALFNLLPIPPFDGSHIVEGALPRRAAAAYERLRPLGFPLVLVVLIVMPMLFPQAELIERYLLPPVQWLVGQLLALAAAVAGA